MSRSQTPPGVRLDLDALGRGPRETVACSRCGNPTRSHTLLNDGQQWTELEGAETVSDIDPGTTVTFAVVCHSCFEELKLPAQGGTRDIVSVQLDGEAVFEGVIG